MPSIIRKWVEDFIAALRAGLAAALRAANVAPAVRASLIADPAVHGLGVPISASAVTKLTSERWQWTIPNGAPPAR